MQTRGHSEAKGQNKSGCTGADFLLLCLLNFYNLLINLISSDGNTSLETSHMVVELERNISTCWSHIFINQLTKKYLRGGMRYSRYYHGVYTEYYSRILLFVIL